MLDAHFQNFKNEYKEIYECRNSMDIHKEVFEGAMSDSDWKNHGHIMNSIGMTDAPKDTSILDMGTQYGLIPHFLSSIGFTDVSYTNSDIEASTSVADLQVVWDKLEIQNADNTPMPFQLHINPQEEFTLPKKYDIILCTETNILWKSDKVLEFHKGILNRGHFVFDSDNIAHSFFTPYSAKDLSYFIDNIKKYLNDGGVAVIQPYPFPYHLESFEKELEMLEVHSSIVWDKFSNLNDFFIIRN